MVLTKLFSNLYLTKCLDITSYFSKIILLFRADFEKAKRRLKSLVHSKLN